jgi:chemotaxis protein histidine kinase CheA
MSDPDFLEMFRDEASERLDHMVATLFAIEAGTHIPGAVESLLRDAHTIKGAAGMLGLEEIQALAHGLEDVLDGVRGADALPTELVDPLLLAAGALRQRIVEGDEEARDAEVAHEPPPLQPPDRDAARRSIRHAAEPPPDDLEDAAIETHAVSLSVLLVERTGRPFGVPLAAIEEAVAVDRALEESLPLVDLAEPEGTSDVSPGAPALIISASGQRAALLCDGLIGKEEVVVKSLGPLLADVRGYLGAAIIDDGRIALLLDPATLVRVRHPGPSAMD